MAPEQQHPDIRAADADRQRVVDQLRLHLGEGRLELTEFEERAAAAFAAKTMGDLVPLLSDLPVLKERSGGGPPARVRPRSPRPTARQREGWDVAYRIHLYVWVVLSVFFVLMGIVTTGIWPIYPIAGIGVSVAIHAAVRKAVLDS